jgi:hypothetical protein
MALSFCVGPDYGLIRLTRTDPFNEDQHRHTGSLLRVLIRSVDRECVVECD